MADYLLMIGDQRALGWLLSEQRMAFTDLRRSEVRDLAPGDRLFLYTTQGCFGNPNRDVGRVIAQGWARSSVRKLDKSLHLAGRRFSAGCAVEFKTVTAWRTGLVFKSLRSNLRFFDGAGEYWSFRLRRPLVRLDKADATVLARRLRRLDLHAVEDVLSDYAAPWLAAQSG